MVWNNEKREFDFSTWALYLRKCSVYAPRDGIVSAKRSDIDNCASFRYAFDNSNGPRGGGCWDCEHGRREDFGEENRNEIAIDGLEDLAGPRFEV